MLCTVLGTYSSVRLEHPLKAADSMEVTEAGMEMLSNWVHPLSQLLPMIVSVGGSVMLFSLLPLKAPGVMVVTVVGMS